MTNYLLIRNNRSGNKDEKVYSAIEQGLKDKDSQLVVKTLDNNSNFSKESEAAVKQAKSENRIVIIAGGDGTVNLVANLCIIHDVVLGIVPMGTFNYFARNLEIPLNDQEAINIIKANNIAQVSVGKVNSHYFFNNASLGLYSKLIQLREQDKSKFGRRRIVAALSALKAFFLYQRKFTVNIQGDKLNKIAQTTLIFVGVNSFQLSRFGLKSAENVDKGQLGLLILKPLKTYEMVKLIVRGIFGLLNFEEKLLQHGTKAFEVQQKKNHRDVVIDGEVVSLSMPLQFTFEEKALKVLVPVKKES